MPEVHWDIATLSPFALLLVAVIGLWIGRLVWLSALIAAVAAGYFTGALASYAAVWLVVLFALAVWYVRERERPSKDWGRLSISAAGLVFGTFALALSIPLLPGFPRTTLTEPVVLSPGAVPFGLGLGFPKVAVGIAILGIIHVRHVGSWRELGSVLTRVAPVFVVTVVAAMMITLAMGFVRFDPKWNPLFLLFAPVNLFFTCFAEEAFFRGFIQHELADVGANKVRSAGIAIAVGAMLFGLSHFGGGWRYVLAATVAGVGYGVAYHRTQRVEGAMAVHLGVNVTHFLLFTYPRLS